MSLERSQSSDNDYDRGRSRHRSITGYRRSSYRHYDDDDDVWGDYGDRNRSRRRSRSRSHSSRRRYSKHHNMSSYDDDGWDDYDDYGRNNSNSKRKKQRIQDDYDLYGNDYKSASSHHHYHHHHLQEYNDEEEFISGTKIMLWHKGSERWSKKWLMQELRDEIGGTERDSSIIDVCRDRSRWIIKVHNRALADRLRRGIIDKGWSVSGLEDSPTSHRIAIKILVPEKVTGWIIGYKGQTIDNIRRESSALLSMGSSEDFYPGTQDRVCLIKGQVDDVKRTAGMLIDRLYTWKPNKDDASNAQVLRLVVPNSICPLLVGKEARNIKHMEETSGVSSIHVFSRYADPMSPSERIVRETSERIVTLTGPSMRSCILCTNMILDYLTEYPDYSRYTIMATYYSAVVTPEKSNRLSNAFTHDKTSTSPSDNPQNSPFRMDDFSGLDEEGISAQNRTAIDDDNVKVLPHKKSSSSKSVTNPESTATTANPSILQNDNDDPSISRRRHEDSGTNDDVDKNIIGRMPVTTAKKSDVAADGLAATADSSDDDAMILANAATGTLYENGYSNSNLCNELHDNDREIKGREFSGLAQIAASSSRSSLSSDHTGGEPVNRKPDGSVLVVEQHGQVNKSQQTTNDDEFQSGSLVDRNDAENTADTTAIDAERKEMDDYQSSQNNGPLLRLEDVNDLFEDIDDLDAITILKEIAGVSTPGDGTTHLDEGKGSKTNQHMVSICKDSNQSSQLKGKMKSDHAKVHYEPGRLIKAIRLAIVQGLKFKEQRDRLAKECESSAEDERVIQMELQAQKKTAEAMGEKYRKLKDKYGNIKLDLLAQKETGKVCGEDLEAERRERKSTESKLQEANQKAGYYKSKKDAAEKRSNEVQGQLHEANARSASLAEKQSTTEAKLNIVHADWGEQSLVLNEKNEENETLRDEVQRQKAEIDRQRVEIQQERETRENIERNYDSMIESMALYTASLPKSAN